MKKRLMVLLVLLMTFINTSVHAEQFNTKPVSYYDDTYTSAKSVSDQIKEYTIEDVKEYLDSNKKSKKLYPELFDFSRKGTITIIVHKTFDKQSYEYLEIYRQVTSNSQDIEELKLFNDKTSNKTLVSTGGIAEGVFHKTPAGKFRIELMESMHFSKKYDNAPMPWSMFFNGGIAFHATTPNGYRKLGQKASHGCVRLHADSAKIIFDFILSQKLKSKVEIIVLDEKDYNKTVFELLN